MFPQRMVTLKETIHAQWHVDRDIALGAADSLWHMQDQNENDLNTAQLADVIEQLTAQVDANRFRDYKQAIKAAEQIVTLGERHQRPDMIALGNMLLGDTVATLGNRHQEAWAYWQQAAQLYLIDGDVIGWARTRTGCVGLCVELNKIEEAMRDAATAREIFVRYDQPELLLRLTINLTKVFNLRNQYSKTIATVEQILPTAQRFATTHDYLGLLCNNIGNAHLNRGETHQAQMYFEDALANLSALGKENACRVVTYNVARIMLIHGQYREALQILHRLDEAYGDQLSIYRVYIKLDIAECYLALNKDREARDLAIEIEAHFAALAQPFPNAVAHTLRLRGASEAKLGNLAASEQHLASAMRLYEGLNATSWQAHLSLMRSRLAIRRGAFEKGERLAHSAETHFNTHAHAISAAHATLLVAQCAWKSGRYEEAFIHSQRALAVAERTQIPDLLYAANLLHGRIYEAQGRVTLARQQYEIAIHIVRKQQRELTITLRPSFLEDKNEAFHAVMRLLLRTGQDTDAFIQLEAAKAQIVSRYVANRQQHAWPASDGLVVQLNRLRQQHHTLYQLVYERSRFAEGIMLAPDVAQTQLQACENEIRLVLEKLYLRGAETWNIQPEPPPNLAAIQAQLATNSVLIAYYSDGESLWAFVVKSNQPIRAHQLPVSMNKLTALISKLQFNIRCALDVRLKSAEITSLAWLAKKLSRKLSTYLLHPDWLQNSQTVYVVPFGQLHYFPFNLLSLGKQYLIETHEVVTLPTSTMLTQPPPRQPAGARILAHSDGGRLPQTIAEAESVQTMLNGVLFTEENATRQTLTVPPVQILHIAAHGKHRVDQPNLSFVQLGDGQLFTDDLLQTDLGYELVTLSACQTARLIVRQGEELIGLGRSVLCAGAGALVASLWHVEDQVTQQLMQNFYRSLIAGATKSVALAQAQRAILSNGSHPAFWAAFQLIGSVAPLSH